jgi:hypothetical protein
MAEKYDYYDTTFFFFVCCISILLHTALAFKLGLQSLTLQRDYYLSSELSFTGSATFFSGLFSY